MANAIRSVLESKHTSQDVEKLRSIKPFIVSADPVHGAHSRPSREPNVIDVDPVHGKHSNPSRKIKEELDQDGNEHLDDFLKRNPNPHIANTTRDVHYKLDHSKEEFEKNPHHKSIKKYSEFSFGTNKELINKATGQSSLHKILPHHSNYESAQKSKSAQAHEDHVKSLDASFNHPNATLKHDVHVYHGTNKWHPGEAARVGGGKINMPTYTSTSINPTIAHDFAHGSNSHILHIHLKKGQKAHYIGSHSHYDTEQEMMLPRNKTLHVHPTPTIVHDGAGGKTHIWHAHIADEEHKPRRRDGKDNKQMEFNF